MLKTETLIFKKSAEAAGDVLFHVDDGHHSELVRQAVKEDPISSFVNFTWCGFAELVTNRSQVASCLR